MVFVLTDINNKQRQSEVAYVALEDWDKDNSKEIYG